MPSFKLKSSWVTILQGVEFSIFVLILAWALQQCSATALPVIVLHYFHAESWFNSYKLRFVVCCNNLVKFVIYLSIFIILIFFLLCLPLVNKADHSTSQNLLLSTPVSLSLITEAFKFRDVRKLPRRFTYGTDLWVGGAGLALPEASSTCRKYLRLWLGGLTSWGATGHVRTHGQQIANEPLVFTGSRRPAPVTSGDRKHCRKTAAWGFIVLSSWRTLWHHGNYNVLRTVTSWEFLWRSQSNDFAAVEVSGGVSP